MFTEYGAVDVVSSPYAFGGGRSLGDAATFVDRNGNGRDDGQETQANMFQALFNTMRRHPDVIHGAFFWDNWLASDETWDEYWADRRTFSIRDKISEDVVRGDIRGLQIAHSAWTPHATVSQFQRTSDGFLDPWIGRDQRMTEHQLASQAQGDVRCRPTNR